MQFRQEIVTPYPMTNHVLNNYCKSVIGYSVKKFLKRVEVVKGSNVLSQCSAPG